MSELLQDQRRALLEQLRARQGTRGHEVIARELEALGVSHVYGISGGPVDETLAACSARGLRVVGTRHQQAAVLASAAHNYVSGTLRSAVIVSAGPGVSNCTTGITVAGANHWPLLVIGGRRDPQLDASGAFQSLDGARLFESITRQSGTVRSISALAAMIRSFRDACLQDEKGPCYLDVPDEVLSSMEHVPQTGTSASADVELSGASSRNLLDVHLVELMRIARRPLLILGDALRWTDDFEAVQALIDTSGLPFISTPMARGLVPDGHPLCATPVRSVALAEADLIVLLGARLDWMLRFGAEIPPSTPVVRCAAGRDAVVAGRTKGIDLQAPPGQFVRELVNEAVHRRIFGAVGADWRLHLSAARRHHAELRAEALADGSLPLRPARALATVQSAIPDDCRTILDGNISMLWAQEMLEVPLPLRRLTAGANGCMGVGIPFAMASCMAEPDVPVLVIGGDFALGVSLQDLETLIRYRLPVVILLMNNGGSGGKLRQAHYWPADHPDLVCRFSPGIRHDLLMKALGGDGEAVTTEDELRSALQRAFRRKGPSLIDVAIADDVASPRFKIGPGRPFTESGVNG